MIRKLEFCTAAVVAMVFSAASVAQSNPGFTERTEASPYTEAVNEDLSQYPDFEDKQDFEDALRGHLAPLSPLVLRTSSPPPAGCRIDCSGGNDFVENNACGTVIWDLAGYEFMNPALCMNPFPEDLVDRLPPAPPSVNPSLWRNAQLNTIHGVFEVVPGEIFQVRGYDLSNMSAIKGADGWIIVDPLTSEETARAALTNLNAAYQDKYGPLPGGGTVSDVIFTHSHVDHFGGAKGLFTGEIPENVDIYAPEGFFEEAVSENVVAGNAMGRRASYMYGPLLPSDELGQVDGGLGKTTPSGTTGLVEPTCVIMTGGTDGDCADLLPAGDLVAGTIGGVNIEFQNVPGSEAPAEMMFYFPHHKALCASEDVTHTFHNVLTLRGANVRDALIWSKYLHKTLKYFDDMEVVFASHHWPTWDKDESGSLQPASRVSVRELIEQQRDLYRYIHDQSVRLLNHGYTLQEVGEMVQLPDDLGKSWFNRDYYGTVNHNAKAVYQRYIGWFDGNPASLHQLPPADAAGKYVEYMGGYQAIVDKAEADLEYVVGTKTPDYRWVAMVLNHVIFDAQRRMNEGGNLGTDQTSYETAKGLLADTYDQLGYQAESGPWRNFYLTGAKELRDNVLVLPAVKTFTEDTVAAMSLEMIFDYLAIRLNGPKADGTASFFLVAVTGGPGGTEEAALYLANGVLNHDVPIGSISSSPDAILEMTRDTLNAIVVWDGKGDSPWDDVIVSGSPGAQDDFDKFVSFIDYFEFWFGIVTPNSPLE